MPYGEEGPGLDIDFDSIEIPGRRHRPSCHQGGHRGGPENPIETSRRSPALSCLRAPLPRGYNDKNDSNSRRDHRVRRTCLSLPGLSPGFFSLYARACDSTRTTSLRRFLVRSSAPPYEALRSTPLPNRSPMRPKSRSAAARRSGSPMKSARELQQARDQRGRRRSETNAWRHPQVSVVPRLAAVLLDGGRLHTRSEEPGHGPGVREPAWREDKVADFVTMSTQSHDDDPHPELPRVLHQEERSRKTRPRAQPGKGRWPTWSTRRRCRDSVRLTVFEPAEGESKPKWPPESLVRTCAGDRWNRAKSSARWWRPRPSGGISLRRERPRLSGRRSGHGSGRLQRTLLPHVRADRRLRPRLDRMFIWPRKPLGGPATSVLPSAAQGAR